jgi:hypothetical protein
MRFQYGVWTTWVFYSQFWADIQSAWSFNTSFVRHSTNYLKNNFLDDNIVLELMSVVFNVNILIFNNNTGNLSCKEKSNSKQFNDTIFLEREILEIGVLSPVSIFKYKKLCKYKQNRYLKLKI